MNKTRSFIAASIYVTLAYLNAPPELLADKEQVKLVAPLKPAQEREDYQECLTAVIKKYRVAGSTKTNKKLETGLAACRDRYPAVSIMINCKKEMAASYRDDHEGLKIALQDCKNEYVKFTYNPKNPVPFVLRGDQAFFAGAGLNLSHPIRAQEDDPSAQGPFMNENFGNYSCDSLYQTMFHERQPEYLLFGNDPFSYTPLRHAKHEDFLKAVGLSAALKKTKTMLLSINKDFGELHYSQAKQETLNYFPLGFCSFSRKLGMIFEGIKIYYLVDRPFTQVTPYFGTAFYRADVQLPISNLAEEIRRTLGDQYHIYKTGSGAHFISQFEPKEFDSEGDPKNLCQSNQTPPYVAIITERKGTGFAAYTLLANISNLCRYGDKIASRFLKHGS